MSSKMDWLHGLVFGFDKLAYYFMHIELRFKLS